MNYAKSLLMSSVPIVCTLIIGEFDRSSYCYLAVDFFCSGPEHQQEDWLAIHEKICEIITLVRSPQGHANTEEERQQRQRQQLHRKVSQQARVLHTVCTIIPLYVDDSNTSSHWHCKKGGGFCVKASLAWPSQLPLKH